MELIQFLLPTLVMDCFEYEVKLENCLYQESAITDNFVIYEQSCIKSTALSSLLAMSGNRSRVP